MLVSGHDDFEVLVKINNYQQHNPKPAMDASAR
jgi:hypothetical protein